MKIFRTFFLVVLCIYVSSCAAIIHGSTQEVNFSSQPSGAKITIDGRDWGVTPKTVVLNRRGRISGEKPGKKEYSVKIETEGFYPYEIKVKRTVDGWFFGNLLFGGLLGIIIDAASGSMYALTPDQVIAQMGRSTVLNGNNDNDNIYIAVTMNPDPSWKKIGTLEKAGN